MGGDAVELVEIRQLDGPNVFLLGPAIKLELCVADGEPSAERLRHLRRFLDRLGLDDESLGGLGAGEGEEDEDDVSPVETLGDVLVEAVVAVHRRAGAPAPEARWTAMETPGHLAVAFGWERRGFAVGVARLVADLAVGVAGLDDDLGDRLSGLAAALETPAAPDDVPALVADAERTLPIVGITGTNGKTTTTRLVAHVLRTAGRKVGWSSTSGVYIEGDEVLAGDWTGPGGARRVLEEPGLDAAVLETARGGILLRGLAYESNDVGVLINVSADHLDLQGVRTLEGLARVKATVVRVTKPGGFAVLNADDPLVRGIAGSVRASLFLVSTVDDNAAVTGHVAAGGHALWVRDGAVIFAHGSQERRLADLAEVPITFAGRATHMVENALCAAAACLSLGLEVEEVAAGLATFRNTADQNRGRLNVYDVGGVTVIADYAHNEPGLRHLLALGRSFVADGRRLVAVIGTAGDRTDAALEEMGRAAGTGSDHVIVKGTLHYLRGRPPGDMERHLAAGVEAAGAAPWSDGETELKALDLALGEAEPGDVVAMMCVDQPAEVAACLAKIGRPVS